METDGKQKLKQFFSTYPLERFKKGELIIRDCDPFTHIYLIKRGHVRLYTVSDSGREVSLYIYNSGWHFPTLIGFARVESRYNFEAMSVVEAYCVPFSEFTAYLKTHADVLYDLTMHCGILMDTYFRRMELLMTESMEKTLAFMLLQFSQTFQSDDIKNQLSGWIVPLSHQQIATWMNTTRETVSRHLENFKKQGIIDISNRMIIIRNKGALLAMVEND